MRKAIPICLWFAVVIGTSWIIFDRFTRPNLPVVQYDESSTNGVVLVDIPWKHLPDVPRFRFTNQANQEFDSATLNGRVYAISFFFATCPTICRDLNRQIAKLNDRTKDLDLNFVSLTVDPEQDTPEVLAKYAADMAAVPGRWELLTGSMHRMKELGEHVFRVVIDKATHTDNILLVDKWGRYRDRFKWDDPLEMKRFVDVARELTAETEPPLSKIVKTRNAMPQVAGTNWAETPWIREFKLTSQQGREIFSRELTGRVWVASFFFSNCPGICPRQNAYIAGLRERIPDKQLQFVSITTDPQNDTTAVLEKYAQQFGAKDDTWLFCTGNPLLIKRISSEYFSASSGGDHHSSLLFVVDRWGRLRGRFDWQKPDEEIAMLKLIDELNREDRPLNFDRIIDSSQAALRPETNDE
jgi:cytochrome oxidase Cu insertion factor (SCO1/SenC/PrrC family)